MFIFRIVGYIEFWLKITIMVAILIASIFLVAVTTEKYVNGVRTKQIEEVTREAQNIIL